MNVWMNEMIFVEFSMMDANYSSSNRVRVEEVIGRWIDNNNKKNRTFSEGLATNRTFQESIFDGHGKVSWGVRWLSTSLLFLCVVDSSLSFLSSSLTSLNDWKRFCCSLSLSLLLISFSLSLFSLSFSSSFWYWEWNEREEERGDGRGEDNSLESESGINFRLFWLTLFIGIFLSLFLLLFCFLFLYYENNQNQNTIPIIWDQDRVQDQVKSTLIDVQNPLLLTIERDFLLVSLLLFVHSPLACFLLQFGIKHLFSIHLSQGKQLPDTNILIFNIY